MIRKPQTLNKIFFLAGEASGDSLGSAIINDFRKQLPKLQCIGFGGAQMRKAGLKQPAKLGDIDAHGLFAIINKIIPLKRKLKLIEQEMLQAKPDLLLVVDIPGIAKRLAKTAGLYGIPCVQVAAPSVGIYRPGRAETFCRLFNRIYCHYDFEPEIFNREFQAQKSNGKAIFIGHPVAENLKQKRNHPKQKHLLCVMPGSRRLEIENHSPTLKRALKKLQDSNKAWKVVIPTVPQHKALLEQRFGNLASLKIVSSPKERLKAMQESTLAWVKMGTAGLELAAYETPQILFYRFNPLDYLLLKFMLLKPYLSLINIIANQAIVPELIQHKFNPENLLAQTQKLLNPKCAKQQTQSAYQLALARLKPPVANNTLKATSANLVVQDLVLNPIPIKNTT